MTTWEYLIVECDADSDSLAKEIVPQGNRGFEVVAILPFKESWEDTVEGRDISGTDSKYRVVFKKPQPPWSV